MSDNQVEIERLKQAREKMSLENGPENALKELGQAIDRVIARGVAWKNKAIMHETGLQLIIAKLKELEQEVLIYSNRGLDPEKLVEVVADITSIRVMADAAVVGNGGDSE